jgi:hypothetical protein
MRKMRGEEKTSEEEEIMRGVRGVGEREEEVKKKEKEKRGREEVGEEREVEKKKVEERKGWMRSQGVLMRYGERRQGRETSHNFQSHITVVNTRQLKTRYSTRQVIIQHNTTLHYTTSQHNNTQHDTTQHSAYVPSTLAKMALNIAVPILPPADSVCATQIFIVQGKIESASKPSL